MKIKLSVTCAAFIFITCMSFSEPAIKFNIAKTGADIPENDGEKHYFIAAGGVLGFNILLASYNRFVIGSSWAKVTWDDMAHFYEHDMSWDRDWYWTNFVLHPYQGSLYYMAARSSNLNILESFLYSTAGSFMWEYFCERNAPSKNDLVYTPIGGVFIGEMFHRLSLEADTVNTLFGKAINPMRLYTEPLTGGKPHGTTGHIHELSIKFGIGAQKQHTTFSGNHINYNGDDSSDSKSEFFPVFAYPEFNVVYNDPYGWDSNEPLAQFDLTGRGAIGAGSGKDNGGGKNIFYDVTFHGNGMIISRELDFGKRKDTSAGVIFDYDFIWQSSLELSSIAPGVAFKQRIRRNNGAKIEWQVHQDWVMIGTSDYYYFIHDMARDDGSVRSEYSYNTGSKTQLIWKYITADKSCLSTNFSLFVLYDFPNQKQKYAYTGWEFIGFADIDYEIAVSERINMGIGNQLYMKKAYYYGANDLLQTSYTGSVFARLKAR